MPRRVRISREGDLVSAAGPALALSAALAGVWLLVDPHTPDLAAQVYRAGVFHRSGFAVWDDRWYAGHHLPGYSLLFPALASLLGVRAVGTISALVSVVLFAALLDADGGRGVRWGAAAFAVAAVGDLWLGRLAFSLGVSLALGAGLAYRWERPLPAAVLAALAAAGSPVAGLLLGLAGLTVALWQRSARPVAVLGLPAAAVVLALAALFPEGGSEPFPFLSFITTAAVGLVFLIALPRGESLLRLGGVVYMAACVVCLVVRSPVGSNIERYGVLLAGPLLVFALLGERPRGMRAPTAGGVFIASRGRFTKPGLGTAGMLSPAAIAVWVLWGPVRETAAVAGSPATKASYYLPVERFLGGLATAPVRIEVPLTRSHWEAALLAPKVSLARGWEKQLDERYDRVLLAGDLTAAGYRRWLDREAVGYVAVPDVQLDPSSAAEGRLISAGLPYLQPVFRSAHWRIYAVEQARPLASGRGRLTAPGSDSFAIQASAAGTILVRVHFTRYWALTAGRGCVGRGPEGFTEVRAAAAGKISIAARFSLSRALGSGASCRH